MNSPDNRTRAKILNSARAVWLVAHAGPRIARISTVSTRFSRLRFWSLLFTVLALTTGFAHLLELPNKIRFTGAEYLAAQQNYRGWAFLGVVILVAIVLDAALVASLRRRMPDLVFAAVALAAMVGTQIIFWTLTFPVNRITQNWTVLPADWNPLRARWEYSHAASAVLELVAVIALLLLAARGQNVASGTRAGGS
jgi:hypothetical protein